MSNKFTGIRDWKLNDINDGDIVKTQQGTRFVVHWSESYGWVIIQENDGSHPDLTGEWFELKKYMQPNLEVVGSIFDQTKQANND